MNDEKQSSPGAHWRRLAKNHPIPRDHAVRQGSITRLAFIILGKPGAIAFLNTENPLLGGRPIALATESIGGHLCVEAELGRLRERQVEALEA